MGLIDTAVAAIGQGLPVVLPTDTVYGLVSSPHTEAATRRIQLLKGRSEGQPLALLAGDIETLLAAVPELRGTPAEAIVRALLPGGFTLVLANPAGRYPWFNGATPAAIGVRVPLLDGVARAILDRAGAVVSTSANLHGGAAPLSLDEVPEEIRSAAGCIVDGGVLPGTPSTVIDFTGAEPRVLREGAEPSGPAIARALAALA